MFQKGHKKKPCGDGMALCLEKNLNKKISKGIYVTDVLSSHTTSNSRHLPARILSLYRGFNWVSITIQSK